MSFRLDEDIILERDIIVGDGDIGDIVIDDSTVEKSVGISIHDMDIQSMLNALPTSTFGVNEDVIFVEDEISLLRVQPIADSLVVYNSSEATSIELTTIVDELYHAHNVLVANRENKTTDTASYFADSLERLSEGNRVLPNPMLKGGKQSLFSGITHEFYNTYSVEINNLDITEIVEELYIYCVVQLDNLPGIVHHGTRETYKIRDPHTQAAVKSMFRTLLENWKSVCGNEESKSLSLLTKGSMAESMLMCSKIKESLDVVDSGETSLAICDDADREYLKTLYTFNGPLVVDGSSFECLCGESIDYDIYSFINSFIASSTQFPINIYRKPLLCPRCNRIHMLSSEIFRAIKERISPATYNVSESISALSNLYGVFSYEYTLSSIKLKELLAGCSPHIRFSGSSKDLFGDSAIEEFEVDDDYDFVDDVTFVEAIVPELDFKGSMQHYKSRVKSYVTSRDVSNSKSVEGNLNIIAKLSCKLGNTNYTQLRKYASHTLLTYLHSKLPFTPTGYLHNVCTFVDAQLCTTPEERMRVDANTRLHNLFLGFINTNRDLLCGLPINTTLRGEVDILPFLCDEVLTDALNYIIDGMLLTHNLDTLITLNQKAIKRGSPINVQPYLKTCGDTVRLPDYDKLLDVVTKGTDFQPELRSLINKKHYVEQYDVTPLNNSYLFKNIYEVAKLCVQFPSKYEVIAEALPVGLLEKVNLLDTKSHLQFYYGDQFTSEELGTSTVQLLSPLSLVREAGEDIDVFLNRVNKAFTDNEAGYMPRYGEWFDEHVQLILDIVQADIVASTPTVDKSLVSDFYRLLACNCPLDVLSRMLGITGVVISLIDTKVDKYEPTTQIDNLRAEYILANHDYKNPILQEAIEEFEVENMLNFELLSLSEIAKFYLEVPEFELGSNFNSYPEDLKSLLRKTYSLDIR